LAAQQSASQTTTLGDLLAEKLSQTASPEDSEASDSEEPDNQ